MDAHEVDPFKHRFSQNEFLVLERSMPPKLSAFGIEEKERQGALFIAR
jgi:hypothetical protein